MLRTAPRSSGCRRASASRRRRVASTNRASRGIPGGEQRERELDHPRRRGGRVPARGQLRGALEPFGRSVVEARQMEDPLKVWGGSALELTVEVDEKRQQRPPVQGARRPRERRRRPGLQRWRRAAQGGPRRATSSSRASSASTRRRSRRARRSGRARSSSCRPDRRHRSLASYIKMTAGDADLDVDDRHEGPRPVHRGHPRRSAPTRAAKRWCSTSNRSPTPPRTRCS